MKLMNLTLTLDREDDGRWIVEVPELPGVMAYGATRDDALAKAKVLALRVLADRIEHFEARPVPIQITLPTAA
jgi:predicted RNase H-like HicB family nuclease